MTGLSLRLIRFTILVTLLLGARDTFAQSTGTSADDWSLPTIALPPEIDRVLRDYERFWRDGEGARLADLFTPDGILLPGGAPPQRGRSAIAASRTRGGGALELVAFAYAVGDTVGYVIGGYRPLPIAPEGRFMLALRRAADGAWRIAADMENGHGTGR